MAFPINRTLVLKVPPLGLRQVDLQVQDAVEKLLHRKVDWVIFREVKSDPKRMTKSFFVKEACTSFHDKD